MTKYREMAEKFTIQLLESAFGPVQFGEHAAVAGYGSAGRARLVAHLVESIGAEMRKQVEQEFRESGKLRQPDQDRFAEVREQHAAIADYCRNKRLALRDATREQSGEDGRVATARELADGILWSLLLDEAHYSRLAKRKEDET